jgi:hypothetical protein
MKQVAYQGPTNTRCHCINAEMVLYTNDTNVLVSDKDLKSQVLKITSVLKQMETWCSENGFVVNTDKTRAMLFHPHQQEYIYKPIITYNNIVICYSSSTKFLGINITDNLGWHDHINKSCKSLNKAYYKIKYLKYVVSVDD